MAEKYEVLFAVYSFKVGLHRKAVPLDKVGGKDMFNVIADALNQKIGKPTIKPKRRDFLTVLSVNANPKTRYIYGQLTYGRYGETRPVNEINTGKQVGTVPAGQSATNRYFFCAFVPKDIETGYLMLQQRGASCNYEFFRSLLEPKLPADAVIRFDRMAPLGYKDAAKKASINRIAFRKRVKDGIHILGLEKHGNMADVRSVTVILDPKPDKNLNSFRGLFGPGKGFGTTTNLDFNPERARLTMDFNGRPMTLSADLEAGGRPAFTEMIEWDADGPSEVAMYAFAKTTFETAMDV